MRVLCADYYPALRSSPESANPGVLLSWATIFETPGIIEVRTDRSDPHYRLYEDCLRSLQATYPGVSFTDSTAVDIAKQPGGLARLHPSFAILVTLLTDRYPEPDLGDIPPGGIPLTLHDSVLDFVLFGVVASTVSPLRNHIACALRDSSGGTPDSDVYQAFFLDCMTALWSHESWRRSNTTNWSPLPWSRASRQELSGLSLIPAPPAVGTPRLSIEDLADENSSALRMAQALIGGPVDIPWFGAPHDGHSFCEALSGYTTIRRGGAVRGLRDDAALWVSAMTFGVLEAVMRARIPESLFVVPGPLERTIVLSGSHILRLLVRWHDALLEAPQNNVPEAHLEHGRAVARLLDRALQALDEEYVQHSSFLRHAGFRPDELTEIVGAVALTIAPLCSVAYRAWRALPEMKRLTEAVHNAGRPFYTAVLTLCERRMRRAGWCPNTVSSSFVSTLWGVPMVSNLARLAPYIRVSRDEHKECTQAACVLYTVTDTDAYVPRHVDPACDCPYVKPPLDEVRGLLSSGAVPAVVYDGTSLRVRPARELPYVAISHVWADGMGSTTEEGLPTCMVKRIAGLVRCLHPEHGAFWMDSLCVPGIGGLRKQAIWLMAQTYRDAAAVLVIDECVRTQCSEEKTWEENLFRIATSGWVRRVWTLQEGLLARALWFEFAEGPMDVEEGLGLKPTGSKAPFPHRAPKVVPSFSLDSHVPVLAFRARSPQNTSRAGASAPVPLGEVVRLLRLRTTTKPEDELIAVSSLLQLDVGALLSITGPDAAARRMRAFLLAQRTVPRALPMHVSPRLTLPGFTWAPRALASEVEGADLTAGSGECTPEGLRAEYLVAALERPAALPEECRDGTRWEYRIIVSHRASRTTYVLRLSVGVGVTGTSIDTLLFLEGDLAVARARPLPCAAACSVGERGGRSKGAAVDDDAQVVEARSGAAKEEPRRLHYVAPGRLHVMAMYMDPDSADHRVDSVIGELGNGLVLLS